ncbi:MAG: hypothetical protein KC505_03255 [Myxococcales bacterium]|nr:hypothetical protein [Myxococcales bacterium]USN51826.1 MAG: hypothetical protein H6731_05315 [Myxococcales bacterium]
MKRLLLTVIFIILSAGCLPKPGLVKKGRASFGVTPPGNEWVQKSFRGAQLFFKHKHQNASIFFNAQCENLSDSPLEALTAQLLIGFSDVHYQKQENIKISDREGLLSILTAKIDGVPRYLEIIILRKNRCVFDAVFNSSPESKDLVKDFSSMMINFWAEAQL